MAGSRTNGKRDCAEHMSRAASAVGSLLVVCLMALFVLQPRHRETPLGVNPQLEFILPYSELPEDIDRPVPDAAAAVKHEASDPSSKGLGAQPARIASTPAPTGDGANASPVDDGEARITIDYRLWAASVHRIEFETEQDVLEKGRTAAARPDTFRMRRAVTGRDIVKGFAMLAGLWPPGYTDDPCPMLRTTVEQLYNSDTGRDATFMKDALEARDRFCT